MTARMDRSSQVALPAVAMLFACGFVLSSTSLLSPFCVSFALTAVLATLLARGAAAASRPEPRHHDR